MHPGWELAISEKRRQSALDHGGTPEENQAIEYALRGLDVLRKDIVRWNGRKSSGQAVQEHLPSSVMAQRQDIHEKHWNILDRAASLIMLVIISVSRLDDNSHPSVHPLMLTADGSCQQLTAAVGRRKQLKTHETASIHLVWPIMSGAATQGTMFGVLRRQSQRKAPHSPLITSEASFADSILPLREW